MSAAVFAALLLPAWGLAAELRGSVSLKESSLFGSRGMVPEGFRVSVALLPAKGRKLPLRPPRAHLLEIAGNRFSPRYLVIQKGDSVRFRNRDAVYHRIFSEAREAPIQFGLGPAAGERSRVQRFDRPGIWHLFCRIHGRSYARIDVVETPRVKMVAPGESFEFRDLAPGPWRLRLAAPGVETRLVEAEAMTAPPPLALSLEPHAATAGRFGVSFSQIGVEQLYPVLPGY